MIPSYTFVYSCRSVLVSTPPPMGSGPESRTVVRAGREAKGGDDERAGPEYESSGDKGAMGIARRIGGNGFEAFVIGRVSGILACSLEGRKELPEGEAGRNALTQDARGNWRFPAGAALVEPQRACARFLARFEKGVRCKATGSTPSQSPLISGTARESRAHRQLRLTSGQTSHDPASPRTSLWIRGRHGPAVGAHGWRKNRSTIA